MIKASKKDEIVLKRVSYIYYLLYFCKAKKNKMRTLINLSSKVNSITPRYNSKLGLKVCLTNVEAQKIDGSSFDIFEIVLASFQVKDKLDQA